MDDRRRARDRLLRRAARACSRPATRPTSRNRSTASGLRGRGGANFSCGQKWSFLPQGVVPALPRRERRRRRAVDVQGPHARRARPAPAHRGHRHLGVRDRQCNLAFIYIRGEFALGYDRLTQAIADATAQGLPRRRTSSAPGFDLEIVVHRGAGAYICGEETALLESLEGERGMPRLKPPFPAIEGLYAKPTVVNNVETLSTVPHIVQMGGEEYAKIGVNRSTGTRDRRDLGSREAARQLRGRVRLHVPRPHLRPRGRHPRRQRAQVLPARRRVVPVADRQRRAPRRALRHGLRAAEPRHHARFGRDHGVRRDHRSAAGRVAAREVLLARVVRQVHAVPRGHGLDREGAVPHGERLGPARRPRPAASTSAPASRPNVATAPFTQTTLCPLGPSVVSPIASLNKYFREEIDGTARRERTERPRDHDRTEDEVGKTTVTVTIDGKTIEAKPGELLIKVAQEHGVVHPALLLARAHEAGRHVPHVPRRGRRRARLPARVHHARRRRHGLPHRSPTR